MASLRFRMKLLSVLFLLVNLSAATKHRVRKDELPQLPKYTSVYEVSNVIGEEFRQKYPDIFNKDDLTAFKKELLNFFILTPDEQKEVFAGTHSRFPVMPVKLRELAPVIEKMFEELDDEDKEYFISPEMYLKYLILVEPVVTLIQQKKEDYDRRELSEEQIKKEIRETETRLHKAWFESKDEL